MKKRSRIRRIGIDIAGFGLLIAALLTGWLPGPGGIPLAIAGLALLSKNHKWAKNIMDYLIENGKDVKKKIFNDHPILVIVYDIVAFSLLAGGIYLIATQSSMYLKFATIALIVLGITIFLFNRNRLESISRSIKSK